MFRKPIKFFLALIIAKFFYTLIKSFPSKNKQSKPGEIALKICPTFLKHFDLPDKVIAITGTNGKNTVTNLINNVLKKNNYQTISNNAATTTSIVTALIKNANYQGKTTADAAIFKIDPFFSKNIFQYITPTHLLCTAIFRDYSQPKSDAESIFKNLNKSIPKQTTLILNADDLISSQLSPKNEKYYFSVKNVLKKSTTNIVQDIQSCPNCNTPLKFKHRHHHHIGQINCKKCNFAQPKANFICSKKDKTLTIKEKENINQYPLISDTIYNIYNITATISLLRTIGLKPGDIKQGLEKATLIDKQEVAYQKEKIEIISILTKNKNPISNSLTFDYINHLNGNKIVVLMTTDSLDKLYGSEDISWLYDTDFEFLKKRNIKQIIACGNRAFDLNIRLQIAGIKNDLIFLNNNYQNIYELINFKKINKIIIAYEANSYQHAHNLKTKIVGELND